MVTVKSIAEWMLKQLDEKNKYLYQEDVAHKIKQEFGDEFVYLNENGNLAIDKKILKEFRKLTEGKVVWDRGEIAWRRLRSTELYKGRQIK